MCMDSTSEQRDKRRRMDIEAVDHNDFPVIPISLIPVLFFYLDKVLSKW
jgi:hypothetical protein